MPSARQTSLAQLDVRRPSRAAAGVSYRTLLWALLGIGLVIRLLFTANTAGNRFDLGSALLVAQGLVHHPAHVYAIANLPGQVPRWPYLPGYFPIVLLVKGVSGLTGLAFTRLFRVPSALADLAIAWLVQDYLGAKGLAERERLLAAALVALGPAFIAISGIHGQIDSAAILPAVGALSVWERDGSPRRAWWAGLLIGLGACFKTVPGLMVFALLPSARSRREAAELVLACLIFPVLSVLPFLAAAGTGWLSTLGHYHGGLGLGGLSLVAQPDLPLNWLHLGSALLNPVSTWFLAHGQIVAVAGIALTAALVLWLRTPAPAAAVLMWLSVYLFGVDFFMQYMVWGLPFFLMAGYLRHVLGLQLLLLGPLWVLYHGVTHAWLASLLYIVPMLIVWLLLAVAFVVLTRRASAHRLAYSSR